RGGHLPAASRSDARHDGSCQRPRHRRQARCLRRARLVRRSSEQGASTTMTDVALRVSTAVTLLWLGMVLAISFLEAPLKFRAPGVDLRTGLAIGRIVFRALNGI